MNNIILPILLVSNVLLPMSSEGAKSLVYSDANKTQISNSSNTNFDKDVNLEVNLKCYESDNPLFKQYCEATLKVTFDSIPTHRKEDVIMIGINDDEPIFKEEQIDNNQYYVVDTKVTYKESKKLTNYSGKLLEDKGSVFKEENYNMFKKLDSRVPYATVKFPADKKQAAGYDGGSRPSKYLHTNYSDFEVTTLFRFYTTRNTVHLVCSYAQKKTDSVFNPKNFDVSLSYPPSISLNYNYRGEYVDLYEVTLSSNHF